MAGNLRSRFLHEITSRQAAEVMARTSTVILPVGTVELHGSHMPAGCDTFISAAFAQRLAEKIDALVAPPEHYSFIGATSNFRGGVSVSFEASIRFLKDIVRGFIKSGFRKILLISVHYPNATTLDAVSRDIFAESGVPVMNISPGLMFDPELTAEVLGSADGSLVETTLLAGALKILGKSDLIDPGSWKDEEKVPVGPESLRRLGRVGSVGYYFRSERSHQPSRAGVEADRGVEIIDRAVEAAKSVSDDLDEYMKFLDEHPPEDVAPFD